MAIAHRDGFPESDVRSLIAQNLFRLNEPAAFDGCVIAESEMRGTDIHTTIELHGCLQKDRWIACQGKGILRIGTSDQNPRNASTPMLMRGDRVRGWATWRVPRNFENPGSADRVGFLARKEIFIIGRSKSYQLLETIPGDCSNPWIALANSSRNHVRTTLVSLKDQEKGAPAAILASLIIGDYSRLTNAIREAFQNSGTFHVLVVSGLHVAWIAGLLLQLFKLIGMPERLRYLLAALAILAYTCIVGFQASITRCLWMFVLYLFGKMLFRHADAVNILFAAGLILLVAEPDWLFESGFQLSFLSVAAIVMTAIPVMDTYIKPVWESMRHAGDSRRLFLQPGRWHHRGRTLRTRSELFVEELTDRFLPNTAPVLYWICRRIAGAGYALSNMLGLSLSVQLWIEPLLAHSYNRISWISPLANIGIVPLSSAALATGILASLAPSICAPMLIKIAGGLASLLFSSAAIIADLPGAWQRCPTPSATWVTGGIGLLSLWSFWKWRRFWIPCTGISVLVLFLACASTPIMNRLLNQWRYRDSGTIKEIGARYSSTLSLTFLDVGEGDCMVIRFPDTRTWVLDAGGLRLAPVQEDNTYAFDIGEAVVSRYLWQEWILRLDRLILSHTDMDHAGGIPALMNNFPISRFQYSKSGADFRILDEILAMARMKRIVEYRTHAGMEEKMGPVTVRTLNPPLESRQSSTNENSLAFHFSFRKFSALLTGDLEKSGEAEVLSQNGNLESSLLKLAHHGSRSATSNAFLDRTRPRWAVISAGYNNPYNHPSPEVMKRLRQHKVPSFSTADHGAITFETDGIRYRIYSHIQGFIEQGFL
jgi:competence protein ComEC